MKGTAGMTNEELIKYLVNSYQPFAIAQYFNWLRGCNDEKKQTFLIIHAGGGKFVKKRTIRREDIKPYFDRLELVMNTEDGKVWEFMAFKHFFVKNKLKDCSWLLERG